MQMQKLKLSSKIILGKYETNLISTQKTQINRLMQKNTLKFA